VVRKVEGYKAFVVGLDHTRYEYLLMTPTNLIGTRGDLDTQFLGRTLSATSFDSDAVASWSNRFCRG
jgi:hypothetical protein